MKPLTAHADLDEELTEQFVVIKNHYGIKGNADMVRVLIREKYRAIQQEKKEEGKKTLD